MEVHEKINIVVIGAGNLASHISGALRNAGHIILQVYSRTNKSAIQLAELLNCDFTTDLSHVRKDADLYILVLSDEAVLDFVSNFTFPHTVAIHMSGGLEMDLFEGKVQNYGVVYPVQTFTKGRSIDFKTIPLCLEANNPETEEFLKGLARQLSHNIHIVDSAQREMIHLAAVYSCNFVNHLYHISFRILQENDLPFELLSSLIIETAEKVKGDLPGNTQTGPAKRNDRVIIDKHLELLSSSVRYQKLYSELSESIRRELDLDNNS